MCDFAGASPKLRRGFLPRTVRPFEGGTVRTVKVNGRPMLPQPLDTGRIGVVPPPWRKWRAFLTGRRITTATFVDVLAEVYEDRTAFILDRGEVISYRELATQVHHAANALRRLGVQRGDRVALCTLNRIEIAFVEFAAQRIGAVPVPLNFMLTAHELRHLVELSGARVMITDRTVFEQNIVDRSNIPSVETWVEVTDRSVGPGLTSWNAVVQEVQGEETVPPADVADEDPAVIFFTAGTTGVPKGAVLSSGALMAGFLRYAKLAAILPTPRKRLALQVMPLAHTGGHQLLLTLLALATPSIVVGRFDAERVLDLLEGHRVTLFAGIPAMYRMFLDAGIEGRDLTSIRLWGGGGDAFPADLIARFQSLAERRVGPFTLRPFFVTGYGMAETSGQVSITPPWTSGDSCIGWFLPGVKARVVDALGQDAEEGELLLQSRGMMSGYWNDAAGTASALKDGWLHTGDVVRVGDFGVKYFVARDKDVIKAGGYSVFPAEVEHALDEHPAVQKSVVVGYPDPVKGEVPVAGVVLHPGQTVTREELLAWARERIAPYRCPRRIEFLESIPQSFAMKPLRRLVRERFV
jgi:acyl-CoA synthetase (AMP-forming)/AMP-acid ligase II